MSSYNWSPLEGSGSGGGVTIYVNFAAFPDPTTVPAGTLAISAATGILYESNGTVWQVIAGPGVALSLGAFGSSPNANAATISSSVLTLQPASASFPGGVSTGVQSFAGNKTFTGTIAASNLSGTNTGDVTLGAVGNSPNANGASLAGQVLTLQPADGSTPGILTAGTQQIGGTKQFTAILSSEFSSDTTNPAQSEIVRFANNEGIAWRNAANLSDVQLYLNTSDILRLTSALTIDGNLIANNFSGSSSGTNTGDVTIGTASGLSLVGQALSLGLASAGVTGALSGTDWSTFNGKQAAGNYITGITGDVVATGPGSVAATIQPGVIVNSMVSASAAIAYSKLNLALSIVNADIAVGAAIAYSKLNLALSIVNGDIAVGAAIARSKTATGNNYRILANDSSGVMSENAAITASRAVASDANGQLVASATTATELGYVNGVTSAIQTQFDSRSGQNYIINGDMRIAQRGTSFAATGGAYTLDRWTTIKSIGASVTISQDTDVPTGAQAGYLFQNSLKWLVTSAGTPGSSDYFVLEQRIEGYNAVSLLQDTFTVSFWARASQTGVFCVSLRNSGQDRSYVAEYTILAANTWEYKTITVLASPTAGTWNYTTGIGLRVTFTQCAGSTFQTTAGSWQTGNFLATSNQVNGTSSSASFYVTGVMVNPGAVAAPFSLCGKTYDKEMMNCQRYYELFTGPSHWVGRYNSTTLYDTGSPFKVDKRTNGWSLVQSATLAANSRIYDIAGVKQPNGTMTKYNNSTNYLSMQGSIATTGTSNTVLNYQCIGNSDYVGADDEI